MKIDLDRVLFPGINQMAQPIIEMGIALMKFEIAEKVTALMADLDYPEDLTKDIVSRLELQVEFCLGEKKR